MCPFSFYHSSRFHKPPCNPGRSDFPNPVLVSAPRIVFWIQTFRYSLRFKCRLTYTPSQYSLPVPSFRESTSFLPVRCLDVDGLPETTEYPESLCLAWVLPTSRMTFKVISEDITLPSLLIRTHAPDRIPPNVSVYPCTLGLCRLSPVPAGNRPFPTLSPQSLYRCKDPYPAALLRCSYPFLPKGLRPHLREQRFGTPNYRRNATSTTELISGLQSFLYVQAPILVRPSGCTHH